MLPSALIDSLKEVKGFDKDAFQKVHQSGEKVTSVRLNPNKLIIDNCQLLIESKIPWSSHGYYLSARPSFTIDPLFHAGAYYAQEASSMFLEEVLKQTVDLSQPLKVLDLCAAPGGKSTLIQSLISDESVLISNDVIKSRANILAENLTKWGATNVIVTNNDPKDFQRLENYFDVIVVDAPCSGSGLFRKDPEAITEWSEQNVALCSQRQQRILADVLPSLKENGILVYSTCSYSKTEDEDICDWMENELSMVNCQLTIENYIGIIETKSSSNCVWVSFLSR
ncbi:MAG: RsmB/NOP family class I SAM-dependent RNA methyltransferase [Ferruginibacter sp.]